LFEKDYRHSSLNTELLEPKHLRIHSFRIDIQYRAIFIINKDGNANFLVKKFDQKKACRNY